MFKIYRNGEEVKIGTLQQAVIIGAGMSALAFIVVSFVFLGGLLATI